MSGSSFDQARNGSVRMDGMNRILRCLDCSRSGKCPEQRLSPWPATEIAEGCTLPAVPQEEDAADMPELWVP